MVGDDTGRGSGLHDHPRVVAPELNCRPHGYGRNKMAQIERLGQPIGEQDLDALESLADARAIAHGGMPLEALDGFFSALVVGPGPLVEPAEYLPLALGDEGPEPAAEEVAV